ncbi:MAG: hypothetical protein IPJ04_09330 [Candidatus Eisenbacteria bacterium]|nr:hypothetical protein [Candidatus Eisenbacteria bacterium]
MWARLITAAFAATLLMAATLGTPAAQAAPDSTATAAAAVPAAAAATPLPAPKLSGYIQMRQVAQEHVGLTQYLNRARFAVDGKLPENFSYRLLTELEASTGAKTAATPSLREAYVRWTKAPVTVTGGQFKAPFSREYLIPLTQLELADLATVLDSLAPKYDVGLMAEYAYGATATLALGVFNGDGANTTANRDSTVMWAARATLRPIPQVGLGFSGTRDGDDSLRWCADASISHLGATVRGEYARRVVRNRPSDKNEFGWYLFESYRVLPRVQLMARQEDYQRPIKGVSRRVRGLAYAAQYDIAPTRVKLLAEFSRRISGAKQLRGDSFIAQVQVVY